jgi:transposase
MITAWHRSSEASRRLDDIPGVGPALATALVASIADPKAFRSGRDFSAWIGLVPKQNSSGGKDKLGNIRQTRRSLSAQPVHDRRAGGDPLCQNPWHRTSALAHGTTGAATDQGRGHRVKPKHRIEQVCAKLGEGQQARPNGLGDDGHRRAYNYPPGLVADQICS